jgi:hypothetical protein
MKTSRLMQKLIFCGVLCAVAGVASAGGTNISTRSIEDINADLMRTYQSHGGPPGGVVRSRSAADVNADLTRNWNAKSAGESGPSVQARSTAEAYADMMRLSVAPAQ